MQAIDYKRRHREEVRALGRTNLVAIADLLIGLINYFERVEPSLPEGLDDVRESSTYTSDLNELRRHVLVVTDRDVRERLQDVLDLLWWLSPIADRCQQHWSFVGHDVAHHGLELAGASIRDERALPMSEDIRRYVGVLEAVRAGEQGRS